MEVGALDIVLPPTDPRIVLHKLVVLLENLSESGEVEILIILEEDEAEVELGKCELQVHHLAPLDLLVSLVGELFIFRAFHLTLERGKLARCLGQFFRVKCVDLGELFPAECEERLVKPDIMQVDFFRQHVAD